MVCLQGSPAQATTSHILHEAHWGDFDANRVEPAHIAGELLGRVSRSRPDLVISQAVVPFANAGSRVAVPFQRLTAVHQPSHLILAEGGAGGDLDEAVKVSRYIS